MKSTSRGRRALSLVGTLCLVPPLTPVFSLGSAFAQEPAACPAVGLAAPERPVHYSAKVQGIATREEVRRETAIAERRTGGAISPDYVNLPRILAIYMIGGVAHSTIAAVVDGLIPQSGDAVQLASRYRDPRSPCNFIPWTVVPASTIS